MYTLTGVTKSYRKGHSVIEALRGVDVQIADGEWLAIQGPTGHGKSTLLQMLGGLDRPSAGRVELDGQDFAAMREGRLTRVRGRSIGFVFQTFNLIPTLSAAENVETALVPLGVRASQRRARAARALESMGLAGRLRHLPSELSGGQQQRVAIARALVKEPTVLLADEPTGNLDETTRDEIIALLADLWRDRGLTMVMVTHDSAVAQYAQRTGVMRDGRLTCGPLAQPAGEPAVPVIAARTPVTVGAAAVTHHGDGYPAGHPAATRPGAPAGAASLLASRAPAGEAAAAAAAPGMPPAPDGAQEWTGPASELTADSPLPALVSRAARLLGAYFGAAASGTGLSPAGLGVVRMLAAGEGLKSSDIAAEGLWAPSTVSAAVDALTREGYVERRRSGLDRRIVRLYLTDEGRRKAAEADAETIPRWQRAFGYVQPADEPTVRKFLMQTIGQFTQLLRDERGE
ncbi:MAG: ATP-binding cassette domain-containing protein [Streptosporangiaceae bacterium]